MHLLENLCGYDDGFDGTIGAHAVRRRKKPRDTSEKVVTVWSVGYPFAD
jgi:DNA-binding response OmpR family regulator